MSAQGSTSANITDSTFTTCQATVIGGGIFASDITSSLNITDCSIQDCQADFGGGLI